MHVTRSFTDICEDEIVKMKPSRRMHRRKNNLWGTFIQLESFS